MLMFAGSISPGVFELSCALSNCTFGKTLSALVKSPLPFGAEFKALLSKELPERYLITGFGALITVGGNS